MKITYHHECLSDLKTKVESKMKMFFNLLCLRYIYNDVLLTNSKIVTYILKPSKYKTVKVVVIANDPNRIR